MLRGWTASANVLPGGSLRRINGLYRSVSADFQGIVARPRIFPRRMVYATCASPEWTTHLKRRSASADFRNGGSETPNRYLRYLRHLIFCPALGAQGLKR